MIKWFKQKRSTGSTEAPIARPPARQPLMMQLEPRVMFDGAVAATVVDATADTSHPAAEQHTSSSLTVDRSVPAAATSATSATDTASASANGHAVVFVDPHVQNATPLLQGLAQGTEVVYLQQGQDGLQQIASYLSAHPGADSIHLLSHGSNGVILVGSTLLDSANINSHAPELAQIGAAMKPGGDFLIYGCDVAENPNGKAFVQQIATASGLNVAASTDATGAATLGGNWTLEYDAGNVHTNVIFSTAAEQNYNHLLSAYAETYDAWAGAFDTGSTPVVSTSLDGLTYTGDQAVEYQVVSGSLPNSGSGGELIVNTQGTQMSKLTIQRQDGALMAVQSFDIDIFVSNDVTVQALDSSGNVIGSITLDYSAGATAYTPGHTINSSLFHVDLSANAAFSQVKSIRLVESSGNGTFLSPTLDNFTYLAPSSPPTLTATGGSTSFVAGDNVASTPVAIDSGITLSDGNSSTAVSATVSIIGNFRSGEDVLAFTNNGSTMGNVTGSYNASTGMLTLNSVGGTATIAQWQAALRSVTYTDTAITPNSATRTISFTITNDGYTSGNTTTKAISVTDTDQTPRVTTTGGTTTYRDGASPVKVDSGISVSDLDNTTQSSGTVSVSTGFHSGDTLSFTNDGSTMGNITGSYNAATGVLTLTSAGATATNAQWAHALSGVTFSSTSTTTGARTIAFATSDGTKTSIAATDIVNVTSPAQVTTNSGSAAFVAGDNTTSTPVVVDSGLTVTDTTVTTLGSATVGIIGNFHSSEDVLAFTNDGSTMGNISGSYNASTGVLTLTSSGATATLAQWQSALRSVLYTDTAITPNNATRTISFTVVDSVSNTSNTATRTVTVTDTDQTPIVTTMGGTTSYVGGTSAVTIDGGISVSDRDNSTQSTATISVTSGFHSGDTLSFTNDGSTMGNIAGSYNAATGVLTLTSAGATATNTQWTNALSSVKFSSTSTTYGNRMISFSTSDGTKTSTAATDTINMTAPPKITTDSGSAAFVAGDNTTSTPVAIDSGLTVTDGSATTLASTTVAIIGNFHSGEDVLVFTNDGSTMGNISGSYNSATGVLTLTSSGATATLAQWQGALQSVVYTDTAITPNNAVRTISFTTVDGAGNTSVTATRTVTVTDTDQTPIVTTTAGTTNYVGGTSAVTIDAGISVSDLDNTTQSTAAIAVTGGFHSGDTLTYVNTNSTTYGNIVGSYNVATGVLTLTSSGGTATNTQWANALSSVKFSASASATPGNRTISFTTNDGVKTSASASHTVDVLGPPVITTVSGSAAFVAGDNTASSPVAIDSGLTLTDGASSTLTSAAVSITGGFHSGEDVLLFTNDGSTMGNISGSYNAATGVLTLTSSGATATLTQWQSALRSVTFTDTAITPTNTTRTISFTVIDSASNTSNTATRTVTVTDTDQTPIVTTTSGTTNYVGGTSAVTIDAGISVSDLDNTTQSTAAIAVTGGFHSGDTLTYVNTNSTTYGNIVGSYNATTGALTLTSSGATATNAQWANALSAVAFSSSSTTYGNRTISFTTSDGVKTSASATRTVGLLSPPTITTDSGAASFVGGDNTTSTPAAIDSGLTVTDGSATTLASTTVAITGNFHSGEDVLAFTNGGLTMGNISGSYNASTGVLTLTSAGATATLAQWQSALRSVTYTDTAITPNNTTRTISFTTVDGNGTTSNTATRMVTVAATDQTPIATSSTGSAVFFAGDNTVSTPVTVDSNLILSDRDNATLASATVSITGNFHSGEDILAFSNDGSTMGNISGNYNSATGVLTLTSSGSTATVAQWQAALRAVTYTDTAITPAGSTRTISFVVSDGSKISAAATRDITMIPTDQTPKLTTSVGSTNFIEGNNVTSIPVTVDSGITVSDLDNATLSSATVSITGNFRSGEDVLAFTNNGTTMGNISASYNATTGVLTLTSPGATATLAQWQAALRSVNYTNSSDTPDTGNRTISFAINDGSAVSSTGTRTVSVASVDDAPQLAVNTGTSLPESTSVTLTLAMLHVTDVDSSTSQLTFTLQSLPERGVLLLNGSALSLSGRFTQADVDAGRLIYKNLQNPGSDSFRFTFSDRASGSTGAVTFNFGVTPASHVPVLAPTAPVVTNTPPPDLPTTAPVPPIVAAAFTPGSAAGAASLVTALPDIRVPDNDRHEFAPSVATSPNQAGFITHGANSDANTPAQLVLQASVVQQTLSDIGAGPFSYTLPLGTFVTADPNAQVSVSAWQANGQPLPSWLSFDPVSGTLRGQPPAGWHQDIDVRIVARDSKGHQASARLHLQFTAGKPGLHRSAPAQHSPQGDARDALHAQDQMAFQRVLLPDAGGQAKAGLAAQFARHGSAVRLHEQQALIRHAQALARTRSTG